MVEEVCVLCVRHECILYLHSRPLLFVLQDCFGDFGTDSPVDGML